MPWGSAELRALVAAKTGGRCMYCGAKLRSNFHVDHFEARSKGGASVVANLMPACGWCNNSKGNRDLEEWRRSLAQTRLRKELNMPYFSKQQRDHLAKIGVDIYANIVLKPFWFEEAANDNTTLPTSEAA